MDTARRNRPDIINRLHALIIGMMTTLFVCAQEVTVIVNPVQDVLPPQAGLYITNPGRFFTIQLINNTDEPQFLHFGLQIQQSSPNDLLWVKTDMTTGHIPQSPITLAPNQHKVLNAVEMRHLFDHFTSQDIYLRDDKYLRVTDGNYGLLPEGQFEAFVTAYKWDTSLTTTVPLSNPQQGRCSFNICYEANPPMFTSPVLTDMAVGFDPTKVVMVDKNNPSFEWMPPSLNCNAARVNFQHSIRIVELNSLNIDEAMMPGVPTFHEKSNIIGNRYTIPQAYVQQMIEPGKAKGKVYAVQLTASTDYFSSVPGSVNFTLLKNGGKSPIMLFQLFDPNVTEPEIVTVPQKGDGDDDDDGYTLSLDGSDADLDDEDSLYIFEQPLLTQPAFPGKMGRTICIGENINAEWRKAWFAGGKGEEQEKVEFEYTVQLFTGNSADSYADIIEANQVIYEAKTEELKATIKWDDIKEKVSQGSYYILRVTAKPTNEESVRMLGDSLNYKDFALTTQFNETYQCGKSTANVTNKNSISAKPDQNTKLKIGAWTLSLDRDYEHVEFDKENKTLKGTGWISWTPGSVRARIAVKFDNLKVNTDYVVFEGECNTFAKSSEKVEGTDCAVDELLGKFFDKETLDDIYGNLGLSEDLRQKVSQYITGEQSDGGTDGEVNDLAKGYNIGKYYSYYKLADSQISSWTDGNFDFYFPLEVPEEIQQFFPENFNVQIANMTFSPTSAVMNLIGEIVLPNSDVFDDQAVLVFGAPRLCIQPDRIFPEDGVLSLLSNFPIKDPNSDFKLVFKAPTDPLNPKAKDGCFIRWENDKFGALGLQIAMTLPNTKRVVDGEVKDMPALLDLLAYIEGDDDACDFIAKGTLTPFQINDLPDWTFHIAEQIIFDHHLSANDMPSYETLTSKYPSNTFDPRLCGNYVESDWTAWQGVYIQNLEVEFPKFAVFGSGDKGLKVGAQNMLIDASGVTCQVYSENIFEAQTGSCGGWAFSVKSASVDIIQNNFDNCKFTGGFGVPLFGKKADEQADKEAQSKGVKPNGKKVDDYTDFKYTCEIRHLTDPKEEIYYTWNAEGTKKDVKRTRRTYEKSQYAYLFRTEPVDNLQLNCFLASVDFSNYKAQNYFLVEARDKKEGSGQDTQVELCMAGDITLAGTDNANARLKALAEKIGVEKLKLQLPGIHFIKMRLSNTPYDKWEDYRAGAAEIRDAAKTEQDNKIAEWKTSIFYHNLAKAKEIQLGEGECYFNMGEWSLASERKKIGPFSFNINKFSPKYEKGMLSLDIDGGIGLIEDKICVDGGFTIGAVLHKEGSIQDWYLSDGDVDFKRLELNLDFAAMLKLKGELTLGDNGQGDNGYAGSLDIEIIGLMTINCAGGYFNHVATNADKQEMNKVANEAASNSIGDGGAANALSEGNYSWGYFTANIASGAGIPVGPLSINRISGGFYFNSKPTKGKEATEKTSAGKFSGDPVASYGMIGVAFGIGMSAASGEETIKGDVDLLVVYDRKKSRLSTFMFNGHVEAVGGIINSDVSLIYENSYDESVNPTVGERYLCLNITLNSGFSNSSLGGSIQKANKYLEEMQEDLNRFGENLGNLVDKEVRTGIEQTLDAISGSYDPEKQAEEEAKKTAEDEKKEKEQIYHVGSTGSVRMSLELKITWKDPGKPVYNTPRWHLYLGQPDKQKRCKITFLYFNSEICKVNIGADAYLCLGNELPTLSNGGVLPDIPPTIQEFLSGHKDANTDMGADLSKAQSSRMSAVKSLLNPNNINGGVMVGASAWGKINIDLGLIFGGLEAIAGFDASLINYGSSAFCVNNHSTMGYDGWYALGQLYAYLAATLGIHVKIGSLIDKKVKLLYAGIGGVLEMGLPKPTWIEGKARVKISLLGGLFSINRQFHFAAGDHCVPFRGNALDGFELFAGVNMGSDSLYQALYQPEFAISKADASKMIVTTNASLGSHHRLVEPSYMSKMAYDFYGTTEPNDEIQEKLKINAARTYVFDMNKDTNKNYQKMGVRLVDLGVTTTKSMIDENLTPEEFYQRNGYNQKEPTVYYAAPAGVTEHSSTKRYDDFKTFVFSEYRDRSTTVEECSSVMYGYELTDREKGLLHQKTNIIEVIDFNLARGKYKFNGELQTYSYDKLNNPKVNEKNVSFREDKGQTFHLTNMELEEGHSYALIFTGDAYEINNGHRIWCEYVDSTTMDEVAMKWRQNKIWFFRVKDKDEDIVDTQSLSTLEPYVALAYPSVDGVKVKNNSNEPFTAYYGDIMHPTIALNRDLRDDLPKDKLKWTLTAYDGKEFANKNPEDCWKMVQTINATYDAADNCFNLRPERDFTPISKFTSAISQNKRQGRLYDYSNELYHLQLGYTYRPVRRNSKGEVMKVNGKTVFASAKDTTVYLVDLWVTAAPHDVTIEGMSGTYNDSWMQSTDREITGRLLPYVVPFVGAKPKSTPVFDYNFKNASGDILTDKEIAFQNYKYTLKDNKQVPYRLIDPWLYLSYLSKWTFIGDRKLNSYDFDEMYLPYASESLIYDFNGTIINSDGFLEKGSKSLVTLRNEMFDTWNFWNFNNSAEPEWPLPSTLNTVGGITAANQNLRASTVAPRILTLSKNDNSYSFSQMAKDFMAPYDVAYSLSSKLKEVALDLWDKCLVTAFYSYDFNKTLNYEVQTWNKKHRGQYIEVSEGGVTVRVPYYQLPLIFGGCFGKKDSPTSTYWGRDMEAKKRSFESSIADNIFSERKKGSSIYADRWYPEMSNVFFFRLLGDKDLPDDDHAPRTFQRPATSEYSPSFKSINQVELDYFNRTIATKEVSEFKATSYRVDAYDVSTGLYHMKNRAAAPWSEDFTIGKNGKYKNLDEFSDNILGIEQDMMVYNDVATPWAIWTESDKTLTLLYSDKNYAMEYTYNNKNITHVFQGEDVVKEFSWTGRKEIRTNIENLVIDPSFSRVELTNLNNSFQNCDKLKTVTGLKYLNMANVISLGAMFRNCKSLENIDLSALDTRNVKDMSFMFEGCEKLKTVNLKGFNTMNVTEMTWMFRGCSQLENIDLSSFTGEHVEKCSGMFYGCSSLKKLDISDFDADEFVKEYGKMFEGVTDALVSYINVNLKEEIKDQIPGRKNMDSKSVRAILAQDKDGNGVLIFMSDPNNLKVGYTGDIKSKYDTYRGLTVKKIFEGDQVLNSGTKVPGWAGDKTIVKVIFDQSFKSSPTSMYAWFKDCENLTTIEVKGTLRTNNVTTMASLFSGCANLESVDFINTFVTTNVTDMSYMFSGCKKLTYINMFKVVFASNKKYFSTENVTTMERMFGGCENLEDVSLSNYFDLGKVEILSYLFYNCKKLEKIYQNTWERELVKATKVRRTVHMFYGCENLKDVNDFVKLIDDSKITDSYLMFYNCKSLTELDLSHFKGGNLAFCNSIFRGCTSLKKLDLSTFMAPKATNMSDMFTNVPKDCYIYLPYNTNSKIYPAQVKKETHPNLVLVYPAKVLLLKENSTDYELLFTSTERNYTVGGKYNGKEIVKCWTGTDVMNTEIDWQLGPWYGRDYSVSDVVKVTIEQSFENVKVLNMYKWFSGMSRLETIWGLQHLNTSEVRNMADMFAGCRSLKSLDLRHFDTSNVEEMQSMFYGCSSLEELDLSSFNTSKVKYMGYMFYDCSRLKTIDLSSFDTRNVAQMYNMFDGCKSLKDIDVSNFNTSQATFMNRMFYGCTSLVNLDLSSFDTKQTGKWDLSEYSCTSLRSLYLGSGFHNETTDDPTYFKDSKNLDIYVKSEEYDRIRGELLQMGFKDGKDGCHIINLSGESMPMAIWTAGNSTLTFTNAPLVTEGSQFGGQKVTTVWYGNDITETPVSNGKVPWTDAVSGKVKTVVINYLFHSVKPKSTAYWFADSGNSMLTSFNGLEYLNTSEVTDMTGMFQNCSKLTTLDLSNFNTKNVTSMANMFSGCSGLTSLDLSGFETSNVTNMEGMFAECGPKKLNITNFNTNKVTNANRMFYKTKIKELKIGSYFLFSSMNSKAVNAFYDVNDFMVIFVRNLIQEYGYGGDYGQACIALEDKLGFVYRKGKTIYIDNVNRKPYVIRTEDLTLTFIYGYYPDLSVGKEFRGHKITNVWKDEEVTNSPVDGSPAWAKSVSKNGKNVATDGSAFGKVEKVIIDESFIDVKPTSTSNWFNLSSMYQNLNSIEGLKYLNTSEVVSMSYMFYYYKGNTLDLSHFDTRNVKSMSSMFASCSELTSLDLSGFDTHLVETMRGMFDWDHKLSSLNIDNFDVRMVKDMNFMFRSCISLTSLDLRSFSISGGSLEQAKSMFSGCRQLKTLHLNDYFNDFNRSKIDSENLAGSFTNVSGLTVYVHTYWNDYPKTEESFLNRMGFTSATGTIKPVKIDY